MNEKTNLIAKLIELDKLKKSYSKQPSQSYLMVDSTILPAKFLKEEGEVPNFVLSLDYVIKKFNELLKRFLIMYDISDFQFVLVVRKYQALNLFEDSIHHFDTRFSRYQFLKFKFKAFDHICAILPFRWFTLFFPNLDPLKFIPDTSDVMLEGLL